MAFNLFFFNPTCEMAVANSQVSYMPPNRLKLFEEQLQIMPFFFADDADYLLLRQPLSNQFIDYVHELGFSVPRFILSASELSLNDVQLSSLQPWGWSPAVHKLFSQFSCFLSDGWKQNPMCIWKPEHKMLLSRQTGYQLYRILSLKLTSDFKFVELPQHLPQPVTNVEQIANLQYVMPLPILLKTPWSASGRGLFKIRNEFENAHKNPWVIGKLKQQGLLFAEQFLNKIHDLSFHFWVDDDVKFLGTTFFKTDDAGQFLGCYLHKPNFSFANFFIDEAIEEAKELLLLSLKEMAIKNDYRGPVGVDAMLFWGKNKQVKLHPCIEVNLRYTMGLLNLFLNKRIHPQSKGFWQIGRFSSNEWYKKQLNNKAIMQDGFLRHGVFALTPFPEKEGFMAWLELDG